MHSRPVRVLQGYARDMTLDHRGAGPCTSRLPISTSRASTSPRQGGVASITTPTPLPGLRYLRHGHREHFVSVRLYDPGGRSPSAVFGHLPAMSVAVARKEFARLRLVIDQGGDPAGAKVKARKDAEEARERDEREITVR